MAKIYADAGFSPAFIVILRDPVYRAYSHYWHMVRNGMEKENFEQALILENERLKRDNTVWCGYYNDGLYARLLNEYLRYFNITQFLFIFYEDLKDEPQMVIRKVLSFLQVHELSHIDTSRQWNKSSMPKSKWIADLIVKQLFIKTLLKPFLPYRFRKFIKQLIKEKNIQYFEYPLMKPETEKTLRKRYIKDIKELEKIINKDLSTWIKLN